MKKALTVALIAVLVLCLSTVTVASNDSKGWKSEEVDSGAVHPFIGYMVDWDDYYHLVENPASPDQVYRSLADLLVAEVENIDRSDVTGLSDSQIRDLAHDAGLTYYYTELEDLTDQVWAVQVEAEPGESGTLTQDLEAAYGAFGGQAIDPHTTVPDVWEGYLEFDDSAGEEADIPDWGDEYWFWQEDEDGIWDVAVGDDYVGNYFHIDQLASTSGGTTKRYISISSPWSHAFIEEDMTVVGESHIDESFVMDNIEPGAEAVPDWWELF